MDATFPSTLAQSDVLRLAVIRGQRELAHAQIEASTGRLADVPGELGHEVSISLDLRSHVGELEQLSKGIGAAATRLEQMQGALTAARDIADGFFANLLAARQAGGDRTLLVEDARSRLETLTQLLNTTSDGIYLFSGRRSDTPAFGDYMTGAGRVQVQAAFATAFPIAPGAIPKAGMEAYLDTTFAALFADPSWTTFFSQADDTGMATQLGVGLTVDVPVTANDGSIRRLYQALVATLDSSLEDLNDETFAAFVDRISQTTATAAADIAGAQSSLGVTQERLAKASERMDGERSLMEQRIAQLEGVDTFEAATRLNTIVNALEASYSVTARLQNFSLLKYL